MHSLAVWWRGLRGTREAEGVGVKSPARRGAAEYIRKKRSESKEESWPHEGRAAGRVQNETPSGRGW